jgi:hypothetical protein
VNIGGLPFLPSSTHLVEELLDELIGNTPESAFEKTTLPSGIHEYIENIDFNEMNVLVGSLRNMEQLQVAIQNNFYHIPYENIKTKGASFKYIALYQSEKAFKEDAGIRYFGEVDEWKLVRRREISEIPKNSDEPYIRFKIKEWKLLDKVIKPKEYGVLSHIYTNMQLLQNAEYLPELCFKDKTEYRLYLEVKRLIGTVDVKTDNIDLDNINDNWFDISGAVVRVEENNIRIMVDGKEKKIKNTEFFAKPRTMTKIICDFIDGD